MTPMCSTTTGQPVGWATATVDCDGTTVAIQYYNTSGVLQGTSLPADWQVCRPSFASTSVNSIVVLTQTEYDALTRDPNTLYIVIGA